MTKYIVIAILFTTHCLHGQNVEWDSLVYHLDNNQATYQSLDRFLVSQEDFQKRKKYQITVSKELSRTLVSDFEQHLFVINKYDKRKERQSFYLSVISMDSTIVRSQLIDKEGKSILERRNDHEFANLVELHSRLLDAEPDTSHKYFNPPYLIVVGFSCSYSGLPRPEFFEMKELIEAERKSELLNWTSSLSPEIRCYGAIGLRVLVQRGLSLTTKEMEHLETVSHDPRYIYTCSGCTDWGLNNQIVDMYYLGLSYFE